MQCDNKDKFKTPPALNSGNDIAIIAPSGGLASIFPHKRDLGIQRLREVFQLKGVLLPSATRERDDSPEARARDVLTAFNDDRFKAVVCTIGGDDIIRVLPFIIGKLNVKPKILLGFSDITALHLLLWKHKVVSYYGGNLLCQFAMGGAMHDYTIEYIKSALFSRGSHEVASSRFYVDGQPDWSNPKNLESQPPSETTSGWQWSSHWQKQSKEGAASHITTYVTIQGRLWGGCVSSIYKILASGTKITKLLIPTPEEIKSSVLFIETSETMPAASTVYDFMSALGERGLLSLFSAVLVGRPQTRFLGKTPAVGRNEFKARQQRQIERAIDEYAPTLPCIFNMDFGHTDPQILVPSGGIVTINGELKSIKFEY